MKLTPKRRSRPAYNGEHFSSTTPTTRYKKLPATAFLLLLLLILAACVPATGGPPTAHKMPTKAPTSPPAGTILYQANLSQGLQSWGNPEGWKIVNGMARSDTSIHNVLTVPYTLQTHNYAISCRFQITQVPRNGGYFLIETPGGNGKDGYVAGILGFLAPGAQISPYGNPQVQIYLDPQSDMDSRMSPIDYEPGNRWHTYRVQVKGPEADLYIDNVNMNTAVSERYPWLSNGPIELVSAEAVINVSDVTITAE